MGGLRKWREPAAEEEDGGEEGHGDHAGVLAQKEQRELQAGIFGVVAGDQFRFSLGEIEGQPIGLRDGGDEIAEKADVTCGASGLRRFHLGRKPQANSRTGR